MTIADDLCLAIAVGALAVAAFMQVNHARLVSPLLKAATTFMEAVSNYGDLMEAKVERRAAAWKAKVREVLAEAGYMVPESFAAEPVGDAPPAPNVRSEPEKVEVARQTGRLDEIHERRREIIRTHEEQTDTNARDSVSEPGIEA